MDLDTWLTAVLNSLGIAGIVAFFIAAAWFLVDWLDEHKPRR